MNEYILLMHQDATDRDAADDPKRWEQYLAQLRSTGHFDGGSSMGRGELFRKDQPSQPAGNDLGGFIRIRAISLESAKQFLAGNPVYEAGGTVEIRELPRT
ncbi:YciI family protein [Variovorax sp. ZS18.2.2]|uniref:YciI family protein n=1 Tax=Variovorax sp. ZS18.2.2 TaxID=2971255 RepID=UPI002151E1D8|nr:YciI family protein [Variovorax sp. ZS18.2.2]MCR6475235.1 YciI family protein [Variovorax sp. ZS18.2.2]